VASLLPVNKTASFNKQEVKHASHLSCVDFLRTIFRFSVQVAIFFVIERIQLVSYNATHLLGAFLRLFV